MKNCLLFIIRWLCIVGLISTSIYTASAQNVTLSYVTTSDLTKGYGKSSATFRVTFVSHCNNVKARIAFPSDVYYTGTVVATANTSSGITIAKDPASPNYAPVFNITKGSNFVAGDVAEFTIERMAHCAEQGGGFDTLSVTNSCGSITALATDPSSKVYNILSPSLAVSTPSAVSNLTVGDTVLNRTTTITNGGGGLIDTLRLYIVYPNNGLQSVNANYSIAVNGNNTFDTIRKSGDTLFYKIYGATIFGGNNTIANNESVVIRENVRFLRCGSNNAARYGATYGRSNSDTCTVATGIAGVLTPNANSPLLDAYSVTSLEQRYDWKWEGEKKVVQVGFRNIGTGAATNLILGIGNQIPNFYTGANLLDTTGGWVVRNARGDSLTTIRILPGQLALSTAHNGSVRRANTPIGGACGDSTVINMVNFNLGDYVLLPNDTVIVDVKYVGMDKRCTSCLDKGVWNFALRTLSTYKGQCGEGSNMILDKSIDAENYFNVVYTLEAPSDVSYLQPDFTAKFNFSSYRYTGYPADHPNAGTLQLVIPLTGTGLTYLGGTTINLQSSGTASLSLPIRNINDTLFIDFPITETGWNARILSNYTLNLNLRASCNPGGAIALETYFMYKYSSLATVVKTRCRTANVTIRCPLPCPTGGVSPELFTFRRINFGSPDNDNNGIPDASGSIDMNKVSLHDVVNNDTVQGTWYLKISKNLDPTDTNYNKVVQYVYVDTRLTINNSGVPGATRNSLMPLSNRLEVYRGGILIHSSNVNMWTITNVRYAHYELERPATGWQDGDSIIFKANFYTRIVSGTDEVDSMGKGDVNYDVTFISENYVYGTFNPQATNHTSTLPNVTYSCYAFNDYLTMHSIRILPFVFNDQVINGCTSNLRYRIQYRIGGFVTKGPFDYEYRNFLLEDTIKIVLPNGFNYRPNSLRLEVLGRSATTLPASKIVQVGNILYLNDVKSIYQGFGGNIVPLNQHGEINAYISLDPQCNAVEGGSIGATNTVFYSTSNAVRQHDTYNDPRYLLNGSEATRAYIYSAPKLVLTGGGNYSSTNGKATWTFQLQNQSSTIPGQNVWLAIAKPGSFSNVVITRNSNNVQVTPNSNNLFEMGNIPVSSNITYTLTADVNSCALDTLQLNLGFSCAAYPTAVDPNCTQGLQFTVNNPQSELQLEVLRQPGNNAPVSLCATDSTLIIMRSSQAAYLTKPILRFTPPVGVTMPATVQVEYPRNSNNYQTVNVYNVGGTYEIRLNEHTGIGASGIPGTLNALNANQREAKVKLDFNTSCDFTSGSSFSIVGNGSRSCDDRIPALGNGTRVSTSPLSIVGAPVTGATASMNIDFENATTPLLCGDVRAITVMVTPINEAASVLDTLLFTLPDGIKLVNISNGWVNVGVENIIKVGMLPTQSNTPSSFTMNVTATEDGCGSGAITAEYIRSINPLTCGNTQCTSSSMVLGRASSGSISIQKPDLIITNGLITSQRFATNAPHSIDLTIFNSGVATTANQFVVEAFCGNNTTPFDVKPLNVAIANNSSETVSFTFNVPATGCTSGDQVTYKISPVTAANGAQCLCTEASFVANVALPVGLAQFDAKKIGQTAALSWTTWKEESNKGFEVERSNDNGFTWNALGFISSKGENGYSNVDLKYAFVDQQPLAGRNMYRLNQIDFNGHSEYSIVRSLVFDQVNGLVVYPNPAQDQLHVKGTNANGKIIIYDITGRQLLHQETAAGLTTLDITNLHDGVYKLYVVDENNGIQFFKFVKNK